MKEIKVIWSEEDLKAEMIYLGFEPTEKNVKIVKENRLKKNVEEAMTRAGWNAIDETIRMALGE